MKNFLRYLPKFAFGIMVSILLTSCSMNRQESQSDGNDEQGAFVFYSRENIVELMQQKESSLTNDIYSNEYQDIANAVVMELKEKEIYSIERPLLIHNPYGTNESGLYLYLGTTDERVTVYYTIHVEDEGVDDFADTAYMKRTTDHRMEAQLIGLVPDRQNKLTLEIRATNGKQLSKKIVYLNIPRMQNRVPIRMQVIPGTVSERTLGITGLLFQEEEKSYYTFYDNNGVLRAVIPVRTTNPSAKIIQVENQILCEYELNHFALIDSNGCVVTRILWSEDGLLTEYVYDREQRRILFLNEDTEGTKKDCVVSYDLNTQEWKDVFYFSKIFRGVDTKNLAASGMQFIDNSDLIFTSTPFNMVFRINHIDNQPTIRWVIGNEEQWKGTFCEDLLLIGKKDAMRMNQIGSAFYFRESGQETGEFHLSVPEAAQEESEHSVLYLLKINENLNQFRIENEIPFEKQEEIFNAVVYGKHCMIHLHELHQIREYTQKGEAVLIADTKDKGFSPMIYKYAMARYWFQ